MKKLLISLIGFFLGTALLGQSSFSWSPSLEVTQTVDANSYTQIYIYQDNQTTGSLELDVEIIYKDVPFGWDGMLCVQGLCLGGIPAVGSTFSMSPISGLTQGYVRWTVNPMGSSASGEVHVRVYDKNNPTDGDTCKFFITGEVLGIENDDDNKNFIIYPNPAKNLLHYTKEGKLDLIQIFSADGKQVKSVELGNNVQDIDISDLPAGVYTVNGISEGILIGRRKLIKK